MEAQESSEARYLELIPKLRLIHDFLCTDPNDMHFPELAERARYFKEDSEGVKAMCKIMEDIKNEGRAEGRAEGRNEIMAKMFRKGYSNEQIADLADKTLAEVEQLRAQLCRCFPCVITA